MTEQVSVIHEVRPRSDNVAIDPVGVYLSGIGKVQLLSAEEEVMLAQRIEAGVFAAKILLVRERLPDEEPDEFTHYGDTHHRELYPDEDLTILAQDGADAKDHMIRANLRLVASIAKRYPTRKSSYLDHIQEGTLGLIRAVEKFDYTRGFKFSTYATNWIKQAISRGIADKEDIIRKPVHTVEKIRKLSVITQALLASNEEPSLELIAEKMKMTPQQVFDLKMADRTVVSLDSPLSSSEPTGATFGDRVASEFAADGYGMEGLDDARSSIFDALQVLSPLERLIIVHKFGLETSDPMDMKSISETTQLSRTRINQIENEALQKLRTASPELIEFIR